MRRHAPIATRTATLLGAGADADDVVQDAFVKAYDALDRFRPGARFRPWLLRIVTNETHNLHRSVSRRAAREWQWAVSSADPTSAAREGVSREDPEASALSTVRREDLMAAVEALPESLRVVVICRYLVELSEAETATTLGLRPGTVKSRLHRALGKLRQEVRDE